MKTLSPCRALVAGAVTLAASAASATTYTYTSIQVPGARTTEPRHINSAGTVVGYSQDRKYVQHGFLFANGKLTRFDVPGATATAPNGIDDKGVVVGTFLDAQSAQHGFIREVSGKFVTVDLKGSPYTGLLDISPDGVAVGEGADASSNLEIFTLSNGVFKTVVDNGKTPVAAAVNDKGSVAGTYEAPRSNEVGFLYAGGKVADIPSGGAYFVQSFGLNKHNVVVGQIAFNAGARIGQYGFIYSGGKMKVRGAPKSNDSFFTGINDLGAIVGSAFTSSASTGFVDNKGIFSILSVPGASYTGAVGINNAGQVIGDFVDSSNSVEAFVAVPSN